MNAEILIVGALILLAQAAVGMLLRKHTTEQVGLIHARLAPPKAAPVKVGGDRVICPTCETSYRFKQLGIQKTSPADKAIVECICGAKIFVSFDANGEAECRV